MAFNTMFWSPNRQQKHYTHRNDNQFKINYIEGTRVKHDLLLTFVIFFFLFLLENIKIDQNKFDI